MKLPFSPRLAALLATWFCLTSCDRQAPPATDAATPPPPPQMAATATARGVTFGEGFYKEEATGGAVLRWVRRDAALRVEVPAAGRYRLTFRPCTVFSKLENPIEVSVGGQPAGRFSARVFDLANPAPGSVEADLRAGGNDLRLHSLGAEMRLGENDDRTASFGLVLPIRVEKSP